MGMIIAPGVVLVDVLLDLGQPFVLLSDESFPEVGQVDRRLRGDEP